ncbi:MAG: hypothetical protein JNK56_20165 [Myxococcales bacterium]|nr:hypothetical protein [Myxococcales bacterium]
MRTRASLIILAWSACGPAPAPGPAAEAVAAEAPVDARRCRPAPGTTGSPATLAEAVALANGLPFPVTAECYVEALDRPLRIEATRSRDSLQPAEGERSPRVFIWGADSLVTSIVLDGPGRELIEFGQFVGPRRTIKGELEFPLTAPVSTAAALDRVRNREYPRITRCFVCHDREEDEPGVPGGRSSLALRPRASTLVDLATLRAELDRCDHAREPARCRFLAALFGHGPVERRGFDAALPVL